MYKIKGYKGNNILADCFNKEIDISENNDKLTKEIELVISNFLNETKESEDIFFFEIYNNEDKVIGVRDNSGLIIYNSAIPTNEEDDYNVYMHYNKINRKKYFGVTSNKNIKVRLNSSNKYLNNSNIQEDIKNYGWKDGFLHIVLCDNLSQVEAEHKKREFITKYNTIDDSKGYNLDNGGIGEGRISDKTKKKMVESSSTKKPVYQIEINTGAILNNFHSIRQAEKETKIDFTSISRNCNGYLDVAKDFFWCFIEDYNEEKVKEKLEYIKEKLKYRLSKIYQIDSKTGDIINIYNNFTELENTKFEYGKVMECCKKRVKTAYKYIWRLEEEYDKNEVFKIINSGKVVQIDSRTGEVIKEWDSVKEVEKELGVSQVSLSKACNGGLNTASGYIWRYKNDYDAQEIQKFLDYYTIFQIDKETGKVIKKWMNTINEIAEILGIDRSSLSRTLKRQNKTSAGYIWRYKNDYNPEEIQKIVKMINK